MNTVERIKKLCKDNKIAISKLEKDLGFGNGYIGQLRKGVVPNDRLKMIADYFNVSMHFLATGEELEFSVEMAQKDLALSNMSERLKEYALKLSEMSEDKQELVLQLIDKLEE